MATNTSILMKQYRDLVRNIASFTNGQGKVEESDCLEKINVTFHIKDGLFRGAKIEFRIYVSDGFPAQPPEITCLTEIYHPNFEFEDDYDIEDGGNVCLNLFDEHWNSDCTLEDVVQGLLFLIYNPNLADPLNSLFYGSEDVEDYEKNVRLSLRGESVDGIPFPRNLPDDYESETEEVENEQTAVSTEDVLAEESVELVATKQTVEQPEITQEDVMVPTENPTVVVDDTIDQTARTNLRTIVRTIFSKVEKLFTGYVERQRTVVESSVDIISNNDVCVT